MTIILVEYFFSPSLLDWPRITQQHRDVMVVFPFSNSGPNGRTSDLACSTNVMTYFIYKLIFRKF